MSRAEWPLLVARLRAIANRLAMSRSNRLRSSIPTADLAIIQEDLDRVVSSMEALLTPQEAVR